MATAEPISKGLYSCLVGHFAYNDQVGRRKKERQKEEGGGSNWTLAVLGNLKKFEISV
jgi:hypothetical protein